ncbi:MAG: tetratricopeptide repeat-containing sensor histidine kinase [Nitritalea sp.]
MILEVRRVRVNNPEAALALIKDWKAQSSAAVLAQVYPRLQNECGAIFYISGNYVKAQAAYTDAYRYLLRHPEYPDEGIHLARALNGRGLVRMMFHDYEQAMRYFMEALEKLKRTTNPDVSLEASLVFNYGLALAEREELDQALTYFFQSLTLLEQMDAPVYERTLRLNRIAKTYLDLGRLEEAEQVLDQLEHHGSLSAWESAFFASTRSELAGAKGDTLQMYRFALEAQEKADAMGALWDKSRALALIAAATFALERWEEAARWQQQLLVVKDSLMTRDKMMEITDFESKIASMERERLAQQLALLQASERIKTLIIGLVVVLLAFFIALFVLQKRNLRLKAQKVDQVQRLLQELQEAHSALQQQSAQLAQVNKTKDKLFSLISHDIRSPLGILISYLRLEEMGFLTQEEQRTSRNKILQQTTDTLAMVDALLIWAKGQLEGFKARPQQLAVLPLLQDVQHLFEAKFADKQLTLHISEPIASLRLFCDEQHLRITFQNILSNAIKFSEVGSVITVAPFDGPEGKVGIKVRNTGPQPTPELLQALNESVQIEDSTPGTAAEKGTGLGLYLVKQLLHQNKGSFHLASWEQGAEACLLLPLAPSSAQEAAGSFYQEAASDKVNG